MIGLITSPAGAVAKYCNEPICLCICLSVREDISGTKRTTFTIFRSNLRQSRPNKAVLKCPSVRACVRTYGSCCIPSCIAHRPLPTYEISLKSKKLTFYLQANSFTNHPQYSAVTLTILVYNDLKVKFFCSKFSAFAKACRTIAITCCMVAQR